MAGFYSAFLLDAELSSGSESASLTDITSSIDFGLGFGAQFSISDAFSLNAGYQMGLSTLDEDGDGDSKNGNVIIGACYTFGG